MTQKIQIYEINSDTEFLNGDNWGETEKGKPVIWIFGRDENRKKIIKKISNYYPYFFVKKNYNLPPEIFKYILQVEKDKFYKTLTDEECYKVFAKNPKCIPKIREVLDRYGIKHYESDVLFRLNYTLDSFEKLKDKISFDIDNCRIFVLDIETTTKYDTIDTVNVPENIICLTIFDNYINHYITWIWRKDFNEESEKVENKLIRKFSSEERMLNDFISFWSRMQPDMVASFNGDNFDLPYIINRCKKLGVRVEFLSPIKRVWDWPDSRSGEVYHNINIMGVVTLDIYHWYKEVALGEQRSYALSAIASDEGIGNKGRINAGQEWIRDWKLLVEYNQQDVYLTKTIMEKRKILDFVSGIRKVALCNINDLYYFSRAIDCLALQKAKVLNLILPTKPVIVNYKSKEEREENFVGAMVMAKQGIYDNVGCFDFSSLYPNIIRTFNLSYETYNFDGEGIEIEIPKGITEKGDKMKVWIKQNQKGLLPQIIEQLIGLRTKYEEGLKNSINAKEASDYDSLIQAVKNLICVAFGAQANESFRLFKREGAAIITTFGRELIREVIRYLEGKNLGVVLTDTDSCYTLIGECSVESGKELEEELNTQILDWAEKKWGIKKENNFLHIKFEKLIKRMIVDKKKRYAIMSCWKKGKELDDKVSVVGFNAKRSDCSLQVEYLQTRVIEMILKKCEEQEIEKLIFEEVEKIKIPSSYTYIGVPVKLGKEKYINNVPKDRAKAYAKEFLGVTYLVGQKPLLIYLKHINSDCILFDDDKQFKGKEIKLDKEKMAERNIFMPLESILTIWKGQNYFKSLKGKILNQLSGQRTL